MRWRIPDGWQRWSRPRKRVREPACARPKCGWRDPAMLDSAGMLIAARRIEQTARARAESPAKFAQRERRLCPSGSAALYRREMLDEIGLFDESFFLYCEDTDLGLRARWAGWECALRAGRGGGASLFAFGRPRVAAQGILRGAQPPVHRHQEFPAGHAVARAVRLAGALFLAPGLAAGRPRQSGRISARRDTPRRCCRFWSSRARVPRCSACRVCCASGGASGARRV